MTTGESEQAVTFDGNQVEGQPSGEQVQEAQVQPAPTGQPEPAKETPSGLTKDEVLELIAESNQSTLTEAQRYAQSLVDKADNRFQKRIEQIQDRAKALGLGENDPAVQQQINEVKRQALVEEFNSEGQQEPSPAQGDAPTDPLAVYANQRQQAIIDEFGGIALQKSDPEAAGIKADTLEEYITSYRTQLAEKVKRLEQESKLPGKPATRLGNLGSGGAPGNPIVDINDPRELIKKGLAGS